MNDALQEARADALKRIAAARTLDELAAVETALLGRKGEVTSRLRSISSLPESERKAAGEAANRLKTLVEQAFLKRRATLESEAAESLAETEWIDVTAPGASPPEGHLHPTNQTITEIARIFERLGFTRVTSPEVEWEYFAFEALNMPANHPARDEWETFFVKAAEGSKAAEVAKVGDTMGRMILTPHTTNVQVREMLRGELPIKVICISKCYRRQSDVTHLPMFHQFEGLLIDRDVTVAHLKGVIQKFVQEFFGADRRIRLRPFHFRFTEPSFEVDITCRACGGTGRVGETTCRLCKDGWVELGGAGMVHPNVLRAGKIDPSVWGGFAFGWGVERTMMMRSGVKVDDIRVLQKNDIRFLRQF